MANALQFAKVTNQKLQVKDTSKNCTVPDNPYAKLMYYLYCVQQVDCGKFPSYMTDYANYRQLSEGQKRAIVDAAKRHDPDEVRCIVEVDELPDNSANKFLQLSAREESLTAFGIQGGGAAMMGLRRELGNTRDLMTIMAYKKSWINNNYYQPLRQVQGGSDGSDASAALSMLLLLRALKFD